MAHWLLEINKNTTNTVTSTGGLTQAEAEVFTALLAGTSTVPVGGNLFLWANAHRKELEAIAQKEGLTLSVKDKRLVWNAPKGHKWFSGSGRVMRLKDTGSLALCYGSKVDGASGLGSTKEKERRVTDIRHLWLEPEEPETLEAVEAVAETPKKAKKTKGKSIKEKK